MRMRNIDIVYRSREMMIQYKRILIPIFLFVSLVGVIPSLISNSLLTLIASILIMPATQGLITSSLKAYRDSGETVETYEDGLYGFKNWTKLFGTYFTYNFIKFVIFFIEVILVTTLVYMVFGDQLMEAVELISQTNYGFLSYEYALMSALGAVFTVLAMIVLPNIIVIIITNIIYDLFFFPVFYLLEDGVKGFEAMGIAKRMMKGKKKQLFLLKLSFFGWIVLAYILTVIIGTVISMLIPIGDNGTFLFTIILSAIISVLVYRVRYQLAMTIFYKEVVGEDTIEMDDHYYDYGESRFKEELPREDDDFYETFSNRQLIMGVGIYLPLYFIGATFLLSIVFGLLINAFGWTDSNFVNSWFNFVVDGTLLIIALFMFRNVFQSAWQYFKSLSLKEIGKLTLAGYGLTYVVMVAGNIVVNLFDLGSESANQVAIEGLMHNFPIPMLFATIVFAPLVEEFVFRGIIFRAMRRFGPTLAILVSGFLFGFIHVSRAVFAGDLSQFIQIAPYMFMGCLFAFLYEKTKSIAVPMYLHVFSNLISVLVILFI